MNEPTIKVYGPMPDIPICHKCGGAAYKTNGKSQLECYNLAMHDDCEGPKPRVVEWTPGRNELCPCGSGKKYKKCCLKK